jgi:hypothetical protein
MIRKVTGAIKRQGSQQGVEVRGIKKKSSIKRRDKIKGHPTKKMVTLEMMIARSTYNKRVAKSRANRKKISMDKVKEIMRGEK